MDKLTGRFYLYANEKCYDATIWITLISNVEPKKPDTKEYFIILVIQSSKTGETDLWL